MNPPFRILCSFHIRQLLTNGMPNMINTQLESVKWMRIVKELRREIVRIVKKRMLIGEESCGRRVVLMRVPERRVQSEGVLHELKHA